MPDWKFLLTFNTSLTIMNNNQRHGFFFIPSDNNNGSVPESKGFFGRDFLGTLSNLRVSQQRQEMFERHKEFLKELFAKASAAGHKTEEKESIEEQKLLAAQRLATSLAQSKFGIVAAVLESYYDVSATSIVAWHSEIFKDAARNWTPDQKELLAIADYLLTTLKANKYKGKIYEYLVTELEAANNQTKLLISLAVFEMYSKTTSYAGNFVRAYVQMYYACHFPDYKEAGNKFRIDAVKTVLKGARDTSAVRGFRGRASVRAANAADDLLLQSTIRMAEEFKQGGRYNQRTTNGTPEMEEFIRYLKEECLMETPLHDNNCVAAAMQAQCAKMIINTTAAMRPSMVNWMAANPEHYATLAYRNLVADLRPKQGTETQYFAGATRAKMVETITKTYGVEPAVSEAMVTVYEMQIFRQEIGNYEMLFGMFIRISIGDEASYYNPARHIHIEALRRAYQMLMSAEIADSRYGPIAKGVKTLSEGIQRDIGLYGFLSPEARELFKIVTGHDQLELQKHYYSRSSAIDSAPAEDHLGDHLGSHLGKETAEMFSAIGKELAATMLFNNFYVQNKLVIDWLADNQDHPVAGIYMTLAHRLRGNATEESYLCGTSRQEMIETLKGEDFLRSETKAAALIKVFEIKSFQGDKADLITMFDLLLGVCLGAVSTSAMTKSNALSLGSTFHARMAGLAKAGGKDGALKDAIVGLIKHISAEGHEGNISKLGLEIYAALTGHYIVVEAKPVAKRAEQHWTDSLKNSAANPQPEAKDASDAPGVMSATVDKVEEKKVSEKTPKEVDQGVTTGVLAAVTHLLSTSTATELAEEELVKAGIQKALHIKALFGRSKADMATVLDTVLRMDSFPYLGSYSEETGVTGVLSATLFGQEPTAPAHLFTKSCLTEMVTLYAVLKKAMEAEKAANA